MRMARATHSLAWSAIGLGFLLGAVAWLVDWPALAISYGLTDQIGSYGRGWLTLTGATLVVAAGAKLLPDLRWPDTSLVNWRGWRTLTVAAIVVYMIIWNYAGFQRFDNFMAPVFDMGVQDQVIWNTAQGRWYASSIEVDNYMGDHFKPLVALLAPLYWITPSVYWLVAYQTVILALGAIPVYRLARDKLQGRFYGWLFALLYLLYPAVGYINRADLHLEASVVCFLLAAIYAAGRHQWRWMSLWLLLTILSKEDMGITVAAFGLWLAWQGERRRGLAWAASGIAASVIILFWVIPTIRNEPPDTLSRYEWLGDSPGAMVRTLLTRPDLVLPRLLSLDALRYMAALTGPLALLPCGSTLMLPALPAIVYHQLSEEPTQRLIYFQYTAPIVPFMVASAITAAVKLQGVALRRHAPWLLWTLLIMLPSFTLWHTLGVNNPLADGKEGPPLWLRQPNAAAIRRALDAIPPQVPVFTTNYYGTYLTQRQELGIMFSPYQTEYLAQADYALLNLLDYRTGHVWTCEHYAAALAYAHAVGYGLLSYEDYVVLLQRNGGDAAALAALAPNVCATLPASAPSSSPAAQPVP